MRLRLSSDPIKELHLPMINDMGPNEEGIEKAKKVKPTNEEEHVIDS